MEFFNYVFEFDDIRGISPLRFVEPSQNGMAFSLYMVYGNAIVISLESQNAVGRESFMNQYQILWERVRVSIINKSYKGK